MPMVCCACIRERTAGGVPVAPWLRIAIACGLLAQGAGAEPADGVVSHRHVTFMTTSDSHYKALEKEVENGRRTLTVTRMNALPGVPWPASLGGDAVAAPRAVMCLGDCIDDGDLAKDGVNISRLQYGFFLRDFGFDGTDGLLRYPVFENWGNHDGPPEGREKNGFSFQAQLKRRNKERLDRKLIRNLSANGLHYSWDWDDVHLVQLGIYPADRQRAGVHYGAAWHDPQDALAFLKEDLAATVGASGRPVVLMAHMGFDTDWWTQEDWRELYDAAKSYEVVLYIYGHTGTKVHEWAPDGATKRWLCLNDGNTGSGFFVVDLTDHSLRLGQQVRRKGKDGTEAWEWANVKRMGLSAPAASLPTVR